MKIFINLTPHEINLFSTESERIFPPSGKIVRLSVEYVTGEIVDGIPTVKRVFGEVIDLPDPQKDTYYLVSSLVADRIKGRNDILIPDTGASAVRDADGKIKGVTRFIAL